MIVKNIILKKYVKKLKRYNVIIKNKEEKTNAKLTNPYYL
jgi:hypothetical protein